MLLVLQTACGVLLGFSLRSHLQADQHIIENHSLGAIRALPEGIFVALLVTAKLAFFDSSPNSVVAVEAL
jgi:hypothetical protein